MLKKYSKQYNKFSIKRGLEELLEDSAARISEQAGKRAGAAWKRLDAEHAGIIQAGARLGFSCNCQLNPRQGREKCSCIDLKRGIRVGHEMMGVPLK